MSLKPRVTPAWWRKRHDGAFIPKCRRVGWKDFNTEEGRELRRTTEALYGAPRQ
jgi:hypothetical protein